jgi:glutamate-5-semialdehyde dehydrogenase
MITDHSLNSGLLAQVKASRHSAQILARLSPEIRHNALLAMADAIDAFSSEILQANQQDQETAREMVTKGELSPSAFARLKLDPLKIQGMVTSIREVVRLPDLLRKPHYRRALDEGLVLERWPVPLGVIGVIFESRPDALTQITSLTLKTANSVLLKGGREALNSCKALTAAIHHGLKTIPEFPLEAVTLLTTREEIKALLSLEEWVDLIVPRGSKAFVQYIQANTTIPVLGHADGICHLYVDAAADLTKAIDLTVDAKVQYPSACNAIETLLVHQGIASKFLPAVAAALQDKGVELRGCDVTRQWIPVKLATDQDWQTEYGDLILSIKVVSSLQEALRHIEQYGSRHTEAIVTEDKTVAQEFLRSVDAAGVFHNASTRFSDGYRYGFGAEVGISTQKLPPRGPVGIEGLLTYKYLLQGEGQVVSTYSGSQARPFRHQELPEEEGL